jgi:hypothetical protein
LKTKLILLCIGIIAVVGISILVRNTGKTDTAVKSRQPSSATEETTVDAPKTTVIRTQPSETTSEKSAVSRSTAPSPGSVGTQPSDPSTAEKTEVAGQAATPSTGERKTTSPEVLKGISDLAGKYAGSSDVDEKSDLINKLADIDDPSAVQQLLAMLHAESDPDLRAEIFQAIAWNDSKDAVASQVISTFDQLYKNTEDLTERLEIQDALGEFDNPLASAMLKGIFNNPQADPEEKMSAAESLLRMRSRDEQLLSYEDATKINEQLQLDYQAVTEPHLKTQAIMALAEMRSENKYFFQQMMTTEQDPSVRRLLEQLVTSIARLESKSGQQVTTAPL